MGCDVNASVISELGGGAERERTKRVGTEADVQSKVGAAGSVVREDATRSWPHEAGPRIWLRPHGLELGVGLIRFLPSCCQELLVIEVPRSSHYKIGRTAELVSQNAFLT